MKEKYEAAKKAAKEANQPDGWLEELSRQAKGVVCTQLYRQDLYKS
jgi:hypothetical protein